MKLKKLTTRGLAHVAAPLLVVVLVAIAGVAFLVGSHADPCNPTQDSCSGSKLTCSISGIPANPRYKQVLRPKLTLANNGHQAIMVNFFADAVSYVTPDRGSLVPGSTSRFTQKIKPGKSVTRSLKSYKVGSANQNQQYVKYEAGYNSKAIDIVCTSVATLPTLPK